MPSLTAMVENSLGVAPASLTPSLAFVANSGRWILQGVASFPV